MNEKEPREVLLSVKEIASRLNRSLNYVYAMKKRGFLMPGGRATLSEATAWLTRNPGPRSRKWGK
jgi:hypothetical protein